MLVRLAQSAHVTLPVWLIIVLTFSVAVFYGAFVFGTLGYWTIVSATRKGDVSVVSPFRYSRLIFAIALGALVFAERPDRMTLIGAALIISSGLYSFARERFRARAAFLRERDAKPGLSTTAKQG